MATHLESLTKVYTFESREVIENQPRESSNNLNGVTLTIGYEADTKKVDYISLQSLRFTQRGFTAFIREMYAKLDQEGF